MSYKSNIEDLEEFDLGFETIPVNDVISVDEYNKKLKAIKKLVIPFLDKLMVDPEKDIHWPNRDKVIGKFKDKLLDILDYGEVIENTKE